MVSKTMSLRFFAESGLAYGSNKLGAFGMPANNAVCGKVNWSKGLP